MRRSITPAAAVLGLGGECLAAVLLFFLSSHSPFSRISFFNGPIDRVHRKTIPGWISCAARLSTMMRSFLQRIACQASVATRPSLYVAGVPPLHPRLGAWSRSLSISLKAHNIVPPRVSLTLGSPKPSLCPARLTPQHKASAALRLLRNLSTKDSSVLASTSAQSSDTELSNKDDDDDGDDDELENQSFLERFFDKSNITVHDASNFNRWSLIPPAVAIHLSLGSVYAWSILNSSFTRELGVVGSAANDWAVMDVVPIFSIITFVHGLSAAMAGTWQEDVGPRRAGVYGALTFGSGLLLSGLGTYLHSLPIALFSGVLIGAGMGLAYVPPVSTLVRWFPDKRGLANGLTVMGFGGGAVISSKAMSWFIDTFQSAPKYVGPAEDVAVTTTEEGAKIVELAGELKEVVVINESVISTLPFPDLIEGVYVVGTGATGTTGTLVSLGAIYLTAMLASALMMKLPPPNYAPPAPTATKPKPQAQIVAAPANAGVGSSDAEATAAVAVTAGRGSSSSDDEEQRAADPMKLQGEYVHIDNVMKTPQFWQIWGTFGAVSLAGMGMLSVANSMMIDLFQPSLPMVTAGFATTYVMALSAANLGGRLGWAALSDRIGRKNVFSIYTLLSVPLYASLPYFIHEAAITQSATPLFGYYAATMALISLFGGSYSTTMAYEADVFGDKYVGAIHGRMLTASAIGGLFGPTLITLLRGNYESEKIREIAPSVDDGAFIAEFGKGKEYLDQLIDSSTITLQKLMQIAPEGIVDPTPFVYDTALYGAAGLLSAAAVANLFMRPVNPKHYHKPLPAKKKKKKRTIENSTTIGQ